MDKDYIVSSVERRNEWESRFGGKFQDFAIALEGEEGWLKLTQKYETPPPAVGSTLHGHIENEERNGKSYRKFRKVNPNFVGGSAQQNAPQLDYIVQMLEELTGRRVVADTVHPVTDEPIDIPDPFKDLGI